MAHRTVREESLQRIRRARDGRRLILAGVLLVVLAGITGVAGDRQATVTASEGGYVLSVEHAQRTRGGMSGDFVVRIRRDGGFDAPVHVAVSARYLELFEQHGITPRPSSATADDDWVHLEFEPPPGDTLRVLYSARVGTSAHRGRSGSVAVIEGGRPAVSVPVETSVLP